MICLEKRLDQSKRYLDIDNLIFFFLTCRIKFKVQYWSLLFTLFQLVRPTLQIIYLKHFVLINIKYHHRAASRPIRPSLSPMQRFSK